jgi:hypothetical protein
VKNTETSVVAGVALITVVTGLAIWVIVATGRRNRVDNDAELPGSGPLLDSSNVSHAGPIAPTSVVQPVTSQLT